MEDIKNLQENLRHLNFDKTRTDVENLFLKEMVETDRDDLLKESTELDAIIPANTASLFGDSSSEDFEDSLRGEDFSDDNIF